MKYPLKTYVREAEIIIGPWHVSILAATTILGVINWSWFILVYQFIFFEAIVLLSLLVSHPFRMHVENLEEEKRIELERKVRVAEETRYRIAEEESIQAMREWDAEFEKHLSASDNRHQYYETIHRQTGRF